MRRVALLPVALSLVAGVTDVTSWILLGGFFSAHVTGNLVILAADVVTRTTPDLAALLAIPVFVITTAGATVLARRIGAHSPRTATALLGTQATLLIAAGALSFTTHASVNPKQGMSVVIGMCAVCAMAAQNAYLHLVPARSVSTAVMTGNLVSATVTATDLIRSRGRDLAAREKWTDNWPLLAGFVVGCLIGAIGATLLNDQASVIPAVLAVALLVWQLTKGRASPPPAITASTFHDPTLEELK
ncbi:YoaK family protein [Microbacterium sp. 1P10UB]|uniref:YoaK family protein n=1 Tax=unclassified Microbacterium TaxID=2609290 RepID=UPI0039A129C3